MTNRRRVTARQKVEEFLVERSTSFFAQRDRLIDAIHLEQYRTSSVPEGGSRANVCGYVACAVRHGLSQLLGQKFPVRTVYGTFDHEDGNIYPHFWADAGGSRGFIVDGSAGYFDPRYERRFLIAQRDHLLLYNIEEYMGGGSPAQDALRRRLLEQNEHPFGEFIRNRPQIVREYRLLVQTLLANPHRRV